jgi:hypothetical protein
VDGPEELGPGSDQDLTVVETQEGGRVYEMTVGSHPRDVMFSTDGGHAYVITADGINVVALRELDSVGKPPPIPVVEDPAIDPNTIEVQVSAAESIALARVEHSPRVFVTDLTTGELAGFDLGGIPTDLDVADTGEFAILTLPRRGGSSFVEIALPDGAPVEHAVGSEYVGLAHIAPDGDKIVLYTTVDPGPDPGEGTGTDTDTDTSAGTGTASSSGTMSVTGATSTTSAATGTSTTASRGGTMPLCEVSGTAGGVCSATGSDDQSPDPRKRLTLVRRGTGDWSEQHNLFVEVPVRAVGVAPDSQTAVLQSHRTPDPEDPDVPYSYTLLDLVKSTPVKKRQDVEADPGPTVFTPEGDRAAVLLRDDTLGIQRVDIADLRTFIVDGLGLGSPPEGGGYVEASHKLFVSQEHATGRITFVDRDGNIQTITGFRLNDAVKD